MKLASVFRSDLFADQTALVTGGGSGIGLRIARELAGLGAQVLLAGREKAKLDQARAVIAGDGGRVDSFVCNIRDEDAVRDMVGAALERAGKIDLLVNNAGGQFPAPAETISRKGWTAVLETNLTGTFLVSREVFSQSMQEGGGAICNMLMNMWNGFPRMAHSGAARAGIENLTRTLAVEWGRYGVRVNAVAPGIIRTSGLDTYDPEFKDFILKQGANNQTYRLGSEAEVAAGVLFLLSPAAAFITGETLKIDGGESLYSPLMPPAAHDRLPAWGDD